MAEEDTPKANYVVRHKNQNIKGKYNCVEVPRPPITRAGVLYAVGKTAESEY
jgi:hypothetical protein